MKALPQTLACLAERAAEGARPASKKSVAGIARLLFVAGALAFPALTVYGAWPLRGFVGDMADSRDRILPLDLNGDGKDDLLYYRSGARYAGAYLSKGDGTLLYVPYCQPNGDNSKTLNGFVGDVSDPRDRAVVLDFNGDGKSDFLWYRPGAGWAGIFRSKGDGSLDYLPLREPSKSHNGFSSDVLSEADTAVAFDLNGDGMSDFLWYRPGSGYAAAYISVEGGKRVQAITYSEPGHPMQNGFGGDAMSPMDRAVALDINEDGRSDFLWYHPGGGLAGVHLSGVPLQKYSLGRLFYVPYRTKDGNDHGFIGDLSDGRDTAAPLDINGDGKRRLSLVSARYWLGLGVHIGPIEGWWPGWLG